MLIRVRHKTTYSYERPAQSVIQLLRLTPRNHEGQSVRKWRIELEEEGTLRSGQDAFGNVTHMLSLGGPIEKITLTVEGEVEKQDTNGILRHSLEPFPPALFLRETDLTQPDAALIDFAKGCAAKAGGSGLKVMHELMAAINQQVAFDTEPTTATTTAVQAFEMKRGVCQDLSHIFIACARSLGIPARYIGGYLLRSDDTPNQEAGHAWIETYIKDLGWVGFDPANGVCPTEAHIRVSVGLDYLGAAPVRGSRYGGSDEQMDVAVVVDQAAGGPTGVQQQRRPTGFGRQMGDQVQQ
ncbi:MAG TPA: transglutaminase family protein [Dongiaceae bacterium]|nr:transglutaminase family protein [Dongiaceae bacterium]